MRLRSLRHLVGRLLDGVSRRARCNLCGWSGRRFKEVGAPGSRRRGECPRCNSRERHRLARHVLEGRLPVAGRVLHVAPERAVAPWLRSLSGAYVSADLYAAADRVEDLTQLSFADDSFDLVWCSHVLEHIPDDVAAMREMFRVLRPGGVAVVQVPLTADVSTTDEDARVTDPDERTRRWGQSDHVRRYGMDLVERLSAVGFDVESIGVDDVERDVVERFAMDGPGTGLVFLCRA